MRTVLKFIGAFILAFIAALAIAVLVGYAESERVINQTYDISPAGLTVPTDAASIAEGERLVAIRGCSDCHGENMAGKLFIDGGPLGVFYTANLTTGQGSAVSGFTPDDWERAIRHGVKPDGRAVAIMPSYDYDQMSDEDVARIIAYLQTLPPVDNAQPPSKVGPLGRLLVANGSLPFAAAVIDHNAVAPKTVTPEVSVAYGEYLAATCTGCHTPTLGGGPLPGAQPGDTPSANLTPSGTPGNWTEEQFINTLRTGVTPEGKQLDPALMPWPIAAKMTETELKALWAYISQVPPAP